MQLEPPYIFEDEISFNCFIDNRPGVNIYSAFRHCFNLWFIRRFSPKNCSKISVKPLESEVTRLLEAAKRMKDSKKIEKADKLFSQAMQFAPDHPELLSE